MYHRLLLLFTYLSPVELQFPVKSSHEVRGNKLVLESLLVDGLDDGAGHRLVVPGDPVQQRLQPARRALDVRVEEGEN